MIPTAVLLTVEAGAVVWFVAVARSVRRRWRRCVCGQMRLRGGTVELGGIKHRLDGPCFHCDVYGEPLS